MALINRFSRLFTADLHAVMHRMEEPETILEQAVREMDNELEKMRSQAQALQIERERCATQDQELRPQLSNLDEEIEVCFGSKEEDLAKRVIRTKFETEKRHQATTSQCAATAKTLTSLESEILENQRHLAGMHQKLEILANELPRPTVFDSGCVDSSVAVEDVEIAFLREQQRRAK